MRLKLHMKKPEKIISYKYLGVYVLDVHEEMPAANVLKAGDQIIQIDNLHFDLHNNLLTMLLQKKQVKKFKSSIFAKRQKKERRLPYKPLKNALIKWDWDFA